MEAVLSPSDELPPVEVTPRQSLPAGLSDLGHGGHSETHDPSFTFTQACCEKAAGEGGEEKGKDLQDDLTPVGTSPAPNAAGHSTAQESRQRQEGTGRQGGTQAKDLIRGTQCQQQSKTSSATRQHS